mgnify:FL=1|tara:strand:+ start:1954 stop:2421 length:468 start_codon:yes stop_codon:yes gene_type:complete
MIKKLPEDIEEIRTRMEKMKNKELRLEGDLAIHEFPDAEMEVSQICLTLFELSKAKALLKSAARPGKEATVELKALRTQLEIHERKVAAIQEKIDALFKKDKGLMTRWQKLQDKVQKCEKEVESIVETHSEVLKQQHIDIQKMFPQLVDIFSALP